VPPELIFDQGLGDLFIIRLAGNIVDDAAAGSIEYAVDHLGVPLVVVLGHKRCGAVDATVKGGEAHGHIPTLVKAIRPAVEMTKGKPGDPVDNAVRANAENMANKLEGNEILKKAKAKVVQGYYDLDTGAVTFWTKR
jgi:carbonic anhydrase